LILRKGRRRFRALPPLHNGKIGIVDLVSKTLLRTLGTGDGGDIRIAISGDGTRLFSRTGIAAKAHVFNMATGGPIKTISLANYRRAPAPTFNHTIAINEDGTRAVFLFPGLKEIRLVDLETGEKLWTRVSDAKQMLFHPDGKRLFVARQTEPLEILNVTNGQVAGGLQTPVIARSLDLSPDGRLIAATLDNGEVAVYVGEAYTPVMRKMEEVPIQQVAFTKSNNLLFVRRRPGQEDAGPALALFAALRGIALGMFMGLIDHPDTLPLRFNVDSGHLLTLQSPPQLWRFVDTPLAALPQPRACFKIGF
jgi:hypothetical protein